MNKGDLAKEIAKKTSVSKTSAWKTLNTTFDVIKASLKKGQKVSLIGFGTWQVKTRKARTGRNPRTGETIKIKARKVPTFSAGADLKNAVK